LKRPYGLRELKINYTARELNKVKGTPDSKGAEDILYLNRVSCKL
jgi:hypothetical protein